MNTRLGAMWRLARSASASRAATLAVGTGVAQALTLIATPLLTRLYGPDVYGQVGVIVSVTAVVCVIAGFGMGPAIVMAEDNIEAAALRRIALASSWIVSGFAALVVAAFHEPIAMALGFGGDSLLLLMVPPLILLTSSATVYRFELARSVRFGRVASAKVAQATVTNGGQLVCGLASTSSLTFVAWVGVGQLAAAAFMRPRVLVSAGDTTRKTHRQIFRKYRDFARFRMPQELLVTFTQNAPQVLLLALYGSVPAGNYALAMRIFSAPVGLVADSVGQVFYSRLASLRGKMTHELGSLIGQTILILAAIGVLPFATVCAFGPQLFKAVFGGEWQLAGSYAAWLSLWVFLSFVNTPAVRAIPVLGLQGWHLGFEVVSVLLRVGVLILSSIASPNDHLRAVAVFSIVSGALSLYLIVFVYAKSRRAVGRDTGDGDVLGRFGGEI